jgi:hypothetical protein
MSPYEELGRAFKLKVRSGEDFEAFAIRASDHVNKCSDAAWKALTEDLQSWVNGVLQIREDNRGKPEGESPDPLPELVGFPDDAEAGDDETGDEETTTDTETGEGEGAVDYGEEEGVEEAAEPPETEAEEPTPRKAAKRASKPAKAAKKVVAKGKAKPVATKKAAAAPPKKAAAKKAVNGGRGAAIGDDAVIKVLAKENPHRAGTKLFKYFEKYEDGMTVAAAKKLKIPPRNIIYLKSLGHIKVVAA